MSSWLVTVIPGVKKPAQGGPFFDVGVLLPVRQLSKAERLYLRNLLLQVLADVGPQHAILVLDAAGGGVRFFDGLSNTQAMAEAGSELAKWALALNINGQNDWYLPSRDELELLYRHFKPTDEENYVYRSGDNPSSLPVGYPYALHLPGKTPVELFREGSSEALEDALYWSSTQYSAINAWYQYFYDGDQNLANKGNTGRARAVRRIKIS